MYSQLPAAAAAATPLLLLLLLALAQTALAVPIFSAGSMPYGLSNYDEDYNKVEVEADERLVFRDIGITPKEIREIQEFEEEFDLTLLDDVLDIISESVREL